MNLSLFAIKDSMQELLLRPRMRQLSFSIILLIVSSLVYANTLTNGFVYDDNQQVLNNQWITNVQYIPEIVSSPVWGFSNINKYVINFYRPMMHILFMVDYHLFGFNAVGFHLTNVLYHSAVTILVFFIICKLLNIADKNISVDNVNYAFLAAILFAAHPIHTEVVAWISTKLELGLTLFYLLSFYLYISSKSIISVNFFFSLFFFFLATLTKETAVTLPALLVLYDLVLGKRGNPLANLREGFKRYIPYILILFFYLLIRTFAIGKFVSLNPSYVSLEWLSIFFNSITLLAKYFFKLLIPSNLSIYHTFNPVESFMEPVLLFSLILFVVLLYVLYASFTKKPLVFLSLAWIVIPLTPVLYIPVIGDNPFTERYLYLPSIGFVFLIAVVIKEVALIKDNIFRYLVCAVLIVTFLYSIGTIKRNYVWRSDYALWKDAVKKSPSKAATHIALGNVYEKMGSFKEALEEFNVAIEVEKDSWIAERNIGRVYRKMGLMNDAVYHYKEAVRINPFSAVVRNDLGAVYGMMGRYEDAIDEFRQALLLDPELKLTEENFEKALQLFGK